jgi:beta-xylosidase
MAFGGTRQSRRPIRSWLAAVVCCLVASVVGDGAVANAEVDSPATATATDPVEGQPPVDSGEGLDEPVVMVQPPVADPSAVVVDGVTYVFGTNRDGHNVPVMSSSDLANWTMLDDAIPSEHYPQWAEIRGRTWAPDVMELADGRFVLYVSVPRKSDGRQCIAVLWSPTVAGPYRDALGRPIFCGWARSGGAIDPSAIRLDDGRVFLYTKVVSYKRQLWVHELRADGHSIIGNRSTPLLTATRPWEQGGIENPTMVADASGWWLFYSGGWWTDGRYATGLARCDGPTGPCRKLSLNGPWMGTNAQRVGPGGADVFDLDGTRYLTYHVWHEGVRQMRLDPLTVAAQGPLPPS